MDVRDLESICIPASDAHRVAVQVVVDDAHFTHHHLGVKGVAGAHSRVEEAAVIGDAVDSHGPCLSEC